MRPSPDELLAQIPSLRRYARALTGERARADDLVQDTLERALCKLPLWRPGNLRAWLFTVMHNRYVSELRSADPLRHAEDENALQELPARATQGDGLALQDLDRALQALPAAQREILLLVALEELAYAEVARILDLPIGTVMSRLSRARENLRRLLADEAPAASPLRAVR